MPDIESVIKALGSWKNIQAGSAGEPSVETEDFLWGFRIDRAGELGLLLSHLRVQAKAKPANSGAKQTELLNRSLSYLDQGFKLVEQHTGQQTLTFRSAAQKVRYDKTSYFEIVLSGGSCLALTHYEFDRGSGQRKVSAANLSMETFRRLLEDLEIILR